MSKSTGLNHEEERDIFGARCKNGHVTYYNKRVVCAQYYEVMREGRFGGQTSRPGVGGDKLRLPCGEEGCSEVNIVTVDCTEYL